MKYIKLAALVFYSFFGLFQVMFGSEQEVVPFTGDVIDKIEAAPSGCGMSSNQILLVTEEKEGEVKAYFQTTEKEFLLTKVDANKILKNFDMNTVANSFYCSLNPAELIQLRVWKLWVTRHDVSVLQKYVQQTDSVQAQVKHQDKITEGVIDKIEFFSVEIKDFKIVHLITTEEGEPKLRFPLTKKEFPLTRVDANRILEKCDVKNDISSLYCNLRKPSQLSESGVLQFYVEKNQELVLQRYVSQPVQAHVHQQEGVSEDVKKAEELLKSATWTDRFAQFEARIIHDEFRWDCIKGKLIIDIKGNFIFVCATED